MDGLLKEIYDYLAETFKNNDERLKHIYMVRDKAIHLGKIYDVDLYDIELAAILHDATKNDDLSQIKKEVHEMDQSIDFNHIPKGCLHAYSAAYLAKNHFHIDNQDIINAIIYHCSGRAGMSPLEQIIYVSDFIEDSRIFVDDELRKTAEQNIDLATCQIIQRTIEYLEKKQQNVSHMTYEALSYYLKKCGGNE
jgi:predicted HD superfamily hydrolase involved in NAD metabolism